MSQNYEIKNIVLSRYESVKMIVIVYIAHLFLMICFLRVFELLIRFITITVLTTKLMVMTKKIREFTYANIGLSFYNSPCLLLFSANITKRSATDHTKVAANIK